MTAAWIGLQQQNVAASTFYRGTDPSMNLPTFTESFTPTASPAGRFSFLLWSTLARHPRRSDVTLSSSNATELRVLAGHNPAGQFCFLITNPTANATSWQIVLPSNVSYHLAAMRN